MCIIIFLYYVHLGVWKNACKASNKTLCMVMIENMKDMVRVSVI